MSQQKIARLIGTSGVFVHQIEHGERKLPPERLRRLAAALDVDPRELEADDDD